MRQSVIAALFLSLVVTLAAQSQNQPTSTLVIKTDVKREVRSKGPDGKELIKTETFQKAKPGDVLVITLSYTNGGKKDDQSGIMYNIKPDSIFVDATGANTLVQVSADGGKGWALHPAVYQVKGSDGKMVEKPVPLDRITNVRWVFLQPVKPGQTGTVTLRIRVR